MELSPGKRTARGLFTNTKHKDFVAYLNVSLSKVLLNMSIYEIYTVFLQLNLDSLIGRASVGEVNIQVKKCFVDNGHVHLKQV